MGRAIAGDVLHGFVAQRRQIDTQEQRFSSTADPDRILKILVRPGTEAVDRDRKATDPEFAHDV